MISAKLKYNKKFLKVLGRQIAYIDVGIGDTIILIHGNPTSSYLWRNIIPEIIKLGRIVVPDLIGHGNSEKIPTSEGPLRYNFHVAYEYLSEFFKLLGLTKNITLVTHDWGSALGFHWAKNHPNSIKGIAYMEALVRPLIWDEWPENAHGIFQGFRSNKGEDLVLNKNIFVEVVLPSAVIRKLTDEEMKNYRAPFTKYEDRQPTLNWPRQIPISGEPKQMVELVAEYSKWIMKSKFPKLFINAEPGSILTGKQREFCRKWTNQTEVTVKGIHFIQEDSPIEIGKSISEWLTNI
tara:strand:+ start:1858 stop:2736 length:879 start_codon:yes stop_codon:yes gene_type:complete